MKFLPTLHGFFYYNLCFKLLNLFRKSRIRNVPSSFLLESINGLTFALLNGQADISLRALDAIHQRAQYELMPDVLLVGKALK